MTESNPVATAEQTGLVYSNTEQEQGRYILINLSPVEGEDSLGVSLSTNGLNNEQVLEVLEKLAAEIREDIAEASTAVSA